MKICEICNLPAFEHAAGKEIEKKDHAFRPKEETPDEVLKAEYEAIARKLKEN